MDDNTLQTCITSMLKLYATPGKSPEQERSVNAALAALFVQTLLPQEKRISSFRMLLRIVRQEMYEN